MCVCVQRQSDVVLVKQQLDLEFNAFANIARYLLCVFFLFLFFWLSCFGAYLSICCVFSLLYHGIVICAFDLLWNICWEHKHEEWFIMHQESHAVINRLLLISSHDPKSFSCFVKAAVLYYVCVFLQKLVHMEMHMSE